MLTVTLALLLRKGLRLDAHEAVAIARAVAARRGVPSADNVEVSSDGSVSVIRRIAAPAVRDLAAFLNGLLAPGAHVPAALRYAIGRGLEQVAAPPFASVEEFSAVLHRFEAGRREDVMRALLARAAAIAPAPSVEPQRPVVADMPAAAALVAMEPAAGAVIFQAYEPAPPRRRSWGTLAGAVALAALGIAGFGLVRYVTVRQPAAGTSTVSSAASTDALFAEEPGAAASSVAQVGTSGAAKPSIAATRGSARDDQPVHLLGDETHPAFSPAFSPTGTSLFFQTGDQRAPTSAIAMASAPRYPDGDLRITTIVDDGSRNYHAQPSPDGESIAFDSDRDGERGVYLANRDGSQVRRISGAGYAGLPSWSPDGTRLAYIRAEADHPAVWNLWVMPVDAGEARRITKYSYGQTWTASWFPDSVRICFTHEDTLIVLDLETGRTQQFASPVRGALVRAPAVSPDGSQVVFQVFHSGAWLLDMADGSMRRLLTDPTAEEFAWAPDGARLAFHSKRDGRWGIYVLSRG